MKVLHTGDWHIRDRDIEEIERCLSFLVDTARDEAVDLAIIAGDTFDSQDVRLDSKSARLAVKTISALADICPVAVIVGTPSHDGQAPEILSYVRGRHTVWVASTPQQVIMTNGSLGQWPLMDRSKIKAVLSLIPQVTKQFMQSPDAEIGAAMSAIFAGFGAQAAGRHPHILIFHGQISGAKASNNQDMTGRDIEVGRDQLELSQADLILCGHLHLPQQLGDKIFYSGSIYPNNFGELHEHGFYIHEVLEKT